MKRFSVFMQRWLGAMRISRVIMILIGLGVAPALVVTATTVHRELNDIEYINSELVALVDFHPIEEVASHASSRMILGALPAERRNAADLKAVEASIEEAMGEVREAMQTTKLAGLGPYWQEMDESWTALREVHPEDTDSRKWFVVHERLFEAALALRDRVGVETGVILDPGSETYPLMDSVFIRIPNIEVELGRAVAAATVATAGDRSNDIIDQMVLANGNIASIASGIEANLNDAKRFSGAQAGRYDTILKDWRQASAAYSALGAELIKIREDSSDRDLAKLMDLSLQAAQAIDALHDSGSERLVWLLEQRREGLYTVLGIQLAALVVFLVLSSWLGSLIGGGISRSLGLAVSSAERIAAGHYDNQIEVRGNNETGRMLKAVSSMQQQLKQRTEEELVARDRERTLMNESLRVKVGLDNVSGSVLLVDRDNQVIYVNRAMQQLLQLAASDFRSVRPGFDPAQLIGQRLSAPGVPTEAARAPTETQVKIGTRTFRIRSSPVVDSRGEWMGAVSEWIDRTQEVAVEEEVADIVKTAAAGDLSRRVALQGKDGFFAVLAEGMNHILGNMSTVVTEISAVVEAGCQQDLKARVDLNGKSGVFRQLATDINSLMESMGGVVTQIRVAAQSVATGADEIAKGNGDLSARTEQQASSLEQTASSMEEMTSTVRQNADNAMQANQLALAARQEAEQGGAVVTSAVEAMRGINESSSKISDIIGVIDEIAFQTNLLALNAAVEAARAGEQGRGFAVVATEVRNLAGRSATAAKEIKHLIQQSVSRVENGTRLVDQSGATLGSIVAAIKKVTDIVAEISAAGQEQSAGIDQVNKAVMQMDGLTQQNAALVEQAASAAESLKQQARDLLTSMEKFRVSDAALPMAAPARPARASGAGKVGAPAAARPKAATAKAAPTPVRRAAGHDAEWTEF